MTDRPIIFSGSMIRALLARKKTQTRRLVRDLRVRLPRPVSSEFVLMRAGLGRAAKRGIYPAVLNQHGAVSAVLPDGERLGLRPGEFHFVCPHAEGETHLADHGNGRKLWTIIPQESRLWTRETWALLDVQSNYPDPETTSEWTGPIPAEEPLDSRILYRADDGPWRDEIATREWRWRSPIFMPRWASRITSEIVSLRIEHLQDIPFYDIRKEGIGCPEHDFPGGLCVSECPTLRRAFVDGWDQINGKRAPYSSNPWCWVLTLKRIEKELIHG
ncbi:MAG: hypothetical protein HY369_00505 [Candidatus Aenigmarchaeota archaeon]|nr:hypothetical protein [Candidatus Aenigmarchaeota archaeon]